MMQLPGGTESVSVSQFQSGTAVMNSRRDFIKKAALLAAGGAFAGGLPASIQKALAIDPPKGSTFLDAEHIVILMQENRSFDHTYGTLQGVRGFNDPRAVTLPNGNPVWLQSNAQGETYAPFRFDIKDSKATWMSSLPHSWVDQVDARNGGKHDRWLEAKRSDNDQYRRMPLTLGYYSRQDIPFYYALADAFTICDQNFCSSLTGTTPNRLYLWTGTIREKPSILSKANVRNEDVDYGSEASWMTFPERLEEQEISWGIYQNELSIPTGLTGEQEDWLANFTDNPIEWFSQYHVQLATDPARLTKLTPREQNLHRKAFITNKGDPHYHELTTLRYKDGPTQRQLRVPKGDVLFQFRQDVRSNRLPTVSWIVAPKNFSDHPGAPWYGAWYLSEVFDILTQNPEVWKKTIFVLCYDENDGYFDHVPPFVPPHPDQADTGKVSSGIDTAVEYVRWEQEQERQRQRPGSAGRAGPIGLGYRVPLVVASPWSRGGYVCSQVFDHTSILQLLEKVLSRKTGRPIVETNISAWRRTICGDLSSVFRPYLGEKLELPKPVEWSSFAGSIHQAQFKLVPRSGKRLSSEEIAQVGENPRAANFLPEQEKGIRPACPLPYELESDGALTPDRKALVIDFASGTKLFGERSAGAPFHVYSLAPVKVKGADPFQFEVGRTWSYAVKAGDRLSDRWSLADFEGGTYHLRVHGPNGFYREFRGGAGDPSFEMKLVMSTSHAGQTHVPVLHLANRESQHALTILVKHSTYGMGQMEITLKPSGENGSTADIALDLTKSLGWYDLEVQVENKPDFKRRYAGHIETGAESFTDPHMGRVIG